MRMIILFLFVSVKLFAQERVNAKIPEISSSVLWSLNEADGWIKNEEGQWIQTKNKIQRAAASVGKKDTWETDYFRTGRNNFVFYEAREIVIDDSKFIVLIKKFRDGFYGVPSLRTSWKDTVRIRYMVFKKNTSKIADRIINGKKINGITGYDTYVFYRGEVSPVPDYLNRIALQINANKDPRLTAGTSFIIRTSMFFQDLTDKKLNRFYIDYDQFEPEIKGYEILSHHAMVEFYYECPQEKMAGLLGLIRE